MNTYNFHKKISRTKNRVGKNLDRFRLGGTGGNRIISEPTSYNKGYATLERAYTYIKLTISLK